MLTQDERQVLAVTLDQAKQIARSCPDPWCDAVDKDGKEVMALLKEIAKAL